MLHRRSLRHLCAALSLAALLGTAEGADRLFVVTTDFMTGSFSTLETQPPWNHEDDIGPIHSDARVRVRGRRVYVVNRYGADNIQILDPDDGYATLCQFSVGPGSNPQDILFWSEAKAYVPRYESAWLAIVDPASCAVVDSISLASFADSDGLPEMERGIVAAGRVFVNIQRLDRDNYYQPVPPSYLAVVDPLTDTLVDVDPSEPGIQGVELLATNPFTELARDPRDGALLVGEVGLFGVPDGGIERIDPVGLVSLGWMITEAALGGDVLAFTVASEDRGFAVVSDPAFNTCLVAFDPGTGSVLETIHCSDGFLLAQDLVAHDGYLFVGDRDPLDPGIRIYDVQSHELLAGPIPVGLPPFDMAILPEVPTGAPEVAGNPGIRVSGPFPCPARERAVLRIEGGPSGRVLVEIVDAAGRLRASRLFRAEGEIRLPTGDLPAGAYWIRIRGPWGATTRPLRIVR
jgi:hypothetical protein